MSDWEAYYEAGRVFLAGGNGYSWVGYLRGVPTLGWFIPAWGVIPLVPLMVLPVWVGYWGSVTANIVVVMMLGKRWGWTKVQTLAFLLSSLSIGSLQEGQIEWIPIMGLLVWGQSGTLGMLLMLCKIQVGGGGLLYRVVEDMRLGRWRRVLWSSFVTGIVGVASIAVYGFPEIWRDWGVSWSVGSLLYPVGMLVGFVWLGLVVLRREGEKKAIAAGVLSSPYWCLATGRWLVVGLGERAMIVYSLLSWVPVLVWVVSCRG